MTTKTIAIYARTSCTEEVTGQSIDAQLRECTNVAIQRYGADINIEIYKDEGVSGQAFHKPALHSLLRHVETKPFTAVIVGSLNRIDRSTFRSVETIRKFWEKHVDFVSVQDGRCLEWDDVHADVKLLLWNLEAETRSKRMQAVWARRKAAQQAANN